MNRHPCANWVYTQCRTHRSISASTRVPLRVASRRAARQSTQWSPTSSLRRRITAIGGSRIRSSTSTGRQWHTKRRPSAIQRSGLRMALIRISTALTQSDELIKNKKALFLCYKDKKRDLFYPRWGSNPQSSAYMCRYRGVLNLRTPKGATK